MVRDKPDEGGELRIAYEIAPDMEANARAAMARICIVTESRI